MDQIWIGELKSNGVFGTVSIGSCMQFGSSYSSKDNTGNGSITGDYAAMPTLWSLVDDGDQYDSNLSNQFGDISMEP